MIAGVLVALVICLHAVIAHLAFFLSPILILHNFQRLQVLRPGGSFRTRQATPCGSPDMVRLPRNAFPSSYGNFQSGGAGPKWAHGFLALQKRRTRMGLGGFAGKPRVHQPQGKAHGSTPKRESKKGLYESEPADNCGLASAAQRGGAVNLSTTPPLPKPAIWANKGDPTTRTPL